MSYRLRLAARAADDLQRLFDYWQSAIRRRPNAREWHLKRLSDFRRLFRLQASPDHPFLREMVIEFGQSGYVALFEIEDADTVTILAMRHKREDDFF